MRERRVRFSVKVRTAAIASRVSVSMRAVHD